MRQKLAEQFHVILKDGCSTRFDEIHLMADCRELFSGNLQKHPDAGGNQESGKIGERQLEDGEKGVHVLKALHYI